MFNEEVQRLYGDLKGQISEASASEIESYLDHDEPECAWHLLWATLSVEKVPLDDATVNRLRTVGLDGDQNLEQMEKDLPLHRA